MKSVTSEFTSLVVALSHYVYLCIGNHSKGTCWVISKIGSSPLLFLDFKVGTHY